MSPDQTTFRLQIMTGLLHYARHPACHPTRNLPVLIAAGNQVLATFRLEPLPAGWPDETGDAS